ncbi:Na+/H+ antiporter NhaC family protein [Salinicoccus sp. HZC-1]|uniref:Na+/H+ antiporter NhaC family protein n=1 Tax=Salinicoccus sp. HZC-1 TaxID=3385497 RepID=UPI00398B2784
MSSIRGSNTQKIPKRNWKFQLPNVLVMMFIIILFACLLTYIVPAGQFETDEAGISVAGTYQSIEQTPVNPLEALNLILEGGIQASQIVILLLFMGGFFGAVFALDSIPNVINYFVYKYENMGPNILVLGLFTLMGFIGFFIGGDMMIVFVTLGVILARKVRLDPISALAMTFLPLFLGFSVGPSGMAMIGQMIASETPLFSGYGMRTVIFLIFISVTAVYVLVYTRRVSKDNSRSLMSNDDWLRELDEDTDIEENKVKTLAWQDMSVLLIMVIAPIVLAIGNTVLGWSEVYGNSTFITVFFIAFVLCFLIKRKSLDDMVASFTKGVQDMVIVAVVIILATTISVILEEGNILSTIVNTMTEPLDGMPIGFSAIVIFIINALFNLLVPSGSGLMGIMIPILQPVADVLGMTQQVLITAIGFGGGLGNLITPTLGVTVGSIALAKANFGSWIKFMMPLFLIWVIIGSVILYYLATIGWTGY